MTVKVKGFGDNWIWICGQLETGQWLPLYNFRPEKRPLAKGTLAALLTAEPGSLLEFNHRQYVDFKLDDPHDEGES